MNTPQKLILLRFLLAPIILLIAWIFEKKGATAIVILMYVGLLSDIFDGIIARKQNSSTEKLRRLDSQVDMIFWLSIGVSSWLLYPELIASNKYCIALVFVMEGLCYVISLLKFKKETCTHAFLSKIWGLTLLIAFTSIIGFGYMGLPFMLAIIFAFISHLDVILIILILPKWQHDVPSSYHAFLIRRGVEFKKSRFLNS
jgi:phosphatidylglycerophosphate synthase